ncbi:hypothetical protein [Stenotrophomonas sp.]|uniref:hypothetical protein n=1 Tax=Stenotrophomonas sp. TaxID=69392 RepID=UPI0028A602E4|nr:hypothetical protein [Stenotrophomonas sp.]
MFYDLPPLLVDEVRTWTAGSVVPVKALVYIHARDNATGVIYTAEWRHDSFEFMSPSQEKDAVAHGGIKFEHNDDFVPARILFSQYHKTATVRGSSLEGSIKEAQER